MKSNLELKQQVANYVGNKFQNYELLLLGSGSTVNEIIKASKTSTQFVSSSRATSLQLHKKGASEISLDQVLIHSTRLCIDGADQILDGGNIIIKGHGGALVREKITWKSATEIVVAIDESKLSDILTKEIPIAVIPFGIQSTINLLEKIDEVIDIQIHSINNLPFNTDDGLQIIYLKVEPDTKLLELHQHLSMLPGVVDTGIFIRKEFKKVNIICAKQEGIIEF